MGESRKFFIVTQQKYSDSHLLLLLQAFAVEILANDPEELDFDHVKSVLVKAGGANYGTGK